MSAGRPSPAREAILDRLTQPRAREGGVAEDAPLDWNDIGFLCQGLVFGARPMHEAISDVVERHSLGPRGGWILNLIAGGIAFPNDLSEVFRVGRSLISAELVRLTEAGLIESEPGETDRRRTRLSLTANGKAAHIEIRDSLFRSLTAALADYTPDEVRLLSRMLQDLRLSAQHPSG